MIIIFVIFLNAVAGLIIGAILNIFTAFKNYSDPTDKNNKPIKYSFKDAGNQIKLKFNNFFWKQFLSLSFWMGFFLRLAIISALILGSRTKYEHSFAIITAIYAIVSLAASRDRESTFKYELVIIGQLLTAFFAIGIWYLIFPQ